MIEQIMYFTLGVLIATLVALLVLPAVWHRAVRLTTKRVEAAVPISIFEVQADKDQQRAFFALNQRRLELQTDAMRETITAHAATIETQRQRTFALETELKALQAQYHLATATGAERDVLLGEIQDQLADRTATVARLEEELTARTSALTALEAAHRTLETDAQALAATLATREATLVSERERIAALEKDTADLRSRLADTTRRLEETSAALESERTAAAEAKTVAAEAATSLSTDLAEIQAALALKTTESDGWREAIAALEAERDRLAGLLAIAERDLDANRAVVHAFEQRRASEFVAAEVENRRLADTLHMLKADHALMEEAIQRAPREAEATPLLAPEGLDAVRDGVTEVAAKLAALTAKLEGPGSPVRRLVADDATGELAARIRALLDQDEDTAQEAEVTGDASAEAPAAAPAAAKRTAAKRGRAVAG
ncbi:hypothetical protein [Xanthobacter oligotrophicus]|uniref:hypothetical protein n=1 Tax=Xanthobacter oligotrophicus TaxID=2607286 RepID=UPI0011F0E642|nr:hypothetical protein [Xanthobacter oligotrophicus]MCG5237409.1 hypothetical protein [Xanthobacter oligotrophicus]